MQGWALLTCLLVQVLSVDDLPMAKDAQKEYEPYLEGIA